MDNPNVSLQEMTIEVHSRRDVQIWTQCLAGVPRRGDRLCSTCYTDEGSHKIVAEVEFVLWIADGSDSECLKPTVVCKAIGRTAGDDAEEHQSDPTWPSHDDMNELELEASKAEGDR